MELSEKGLLFFSSMLQPFYTLNILEKIQYFRCYVLDFEEFISKYFVPLDGLTETNKDTTNLRKIAQTLAQVKTVLLMNFIVLIKSLNKSFH